MEEAPLPALTPDILVLIFHRLPIRSVIQCKLVCKEWCSLISDPLFKSTYNPSIIPNHPLSLMMIPRSTASLPKRQKDFALIYEIDRLGNPLVGCRRRQPLPGDLSGEDRIRILGSWNGLVALYRDPGDFCLFNPFTSKEEVVHVAMDDEQYVNFWWSWNPYGLCHDYATGEFKAVMVISLCFCDSPSFLVVSFKDGNWKLKTQSEAGSLYPLTSRLGTIVKGVPHWICRVKSKISLLYFDPDKEVFEKIQMPQAWGGKQIFGLGALDGHLTVAAASVVNGRPVRGLEVWVMREDGNEDSWSKLFVITYKLRCLSILSWIKEDEILMDVNREVLMVYNVRNQTLRPLQKKMKRSSYSIRTYIPSFVSPTQ